MSDGRTSRVPRLRVAAALLLPLLLLCLALAAGAFDPQDAPRPAAAIPPVANAPQANAPAASGPADLTIAELEARFGENRLVPDPDGWDVPADAPRDGVVHRWFGPTPRVLNGVIASDAAVVDYLNTHCLLPIGVRHRLEPGLFAPGVADYASATDDLSTITVRLKKGIRWQFPLVDRDDPRHRWLADLFEREPPELTAEDFRFTLDMLLDPAVGSIGWRSLMEPASIEVLDRYTFQVHWSRFYVYAFELSVDWQAVLPAFLYTRDEEGRPFAPEDLAAAFNDHWYNNRLCGYGPYTFAGWEPNVEIVLRRADDFAPMRPAVREIRFQIFSDPEQVVLRMKAGQLDWGALLPNQFKQYVLDAPEGSDFRGGRFRVHEYDQLNYVYLGWNCRRPPFDDPRVRNAMARAFNRPLLLERAMYGMGSLIESHVFTRHPHCNHDLEPIPFDLAEASRLLDEAGWNDRDGDGVREKTIGGVEVPLAFTMKSFDGAMFATAMAVYRDDLKRIGADMTVAQLQWPQMLQEIFTDRDFQAFTGGVSLGWNVDFYPSFHSDGSSNTTGFSSAELDPLIVAYRESRDDAERKGIAFRIQELLQRDQPVTYFFLRRQATVYQPWLSNVRYATSRPHSPSWAWVCEPR